MNDPFSTVKIGIISAVGVGESIKVNTSNESELCLRVPAKDMNATYDDLKNCDGFFVCVPSPQNQDGSCDSSILEEGLEDLEGYIRVIISKVIAPLNVLSKRYRCISTLR